MARGIGRRAGARTLLIERKGYPGGTVVEGGTALHSYFNLWKAFPGVARKQVVNGIPQEIVDRLARVGGTSGHAEMVSGYDYDSVCTAIDTELYNTVCCMGQGQAAGTAAALCAAKSCGTRELAYPLLREALLKAGVHLEG